MEGITIKDAAKQLQVESHVLRYWEEELELEIKRNSLGHRYYDERDIKLFGSIKELKSRGMSLKDIKEGIRHQTKKNSDKKIDTVSQENRKLNQESESVEESTHKDNNKEISEIDSDKIVDFKLVQLQNVMNKVIAIALKENKDIITSSIKAEVTADVMRQFDAVMREKEEKEEARFRKLDECLRQIQKTNDEVAATKVKRRFGRRKY